MIFVILIILCVVWFFCDLIFGKSDTISPEERINDCIRGMNSLTRKKTKEEEDEEQNRDRNTYI